jgi:hypothetical protein
VTHDVLKKLGLVGKGFDGYSLDNVKMFRNDAVKVDSRLP